MTGYPDLSRKCMRIKYLERLNTGSKQHYISFDVRLWRRRVTVVNATGADGHRLYHKHYENTTTNNPVVMPFILILNIALND